MGASTLKHLVESKAKLMDEKTDLFIQLLATLPIHICI